MSTVRKVILALLALVLTVVMMRTWGSVGSVLMGFCLITMGSSLLIQRFITNQDKPDFQMEV